MQVKTKKTIVKVIIDISMFMFAYTLVELLQLRDNLTFTLIMGVLLKKICEVLNEIIDEREDK